MIVLRLPGGDVLVIYPDGITRRIRPDGSTVPEVAPETTRSTKLKPTSAVSLVAANVSAGQS